MPSCAQWYGFHVNIQAVGLVQQQAALQIYLAVGQLPGSGWKGLNEGWGLKLDCSWLPGCAFCFAAVQLCSTRLLNIAFVGLRVLLADTNTASACRNLCHVLCSLLLHSPQRHVGLHAGMCGLLTLLNSPKAELSVAELCLAGPCRVASTLATWQLVRMVPAKCMGPLLLKVLLVLNQGLHRLQCALHSSCCSVS